MTKGSPTIPTKFESRRNHWQRKFAQVLSGTHPKKELEPFLVFAASSLCLPQIGLGVINIEFDNIKFFFSFTRSFYVTLKRPFPDQGKFSTIWESIEKPFLALFYFLRYCRKMDSSFLRYNTVCHNTLCISL